MKAKARQFIFGIVLMLNSALQYYLWFQYKMPTNIIISSTLAWIIGGIVCIRTFKD